MFDWSKAACPLVGHVNVSIVPDLQAQASSPPLHSDEDEEGPPQESIAPFDEWTKLQLSKHKLQHQQQHALVG